jgi:serine/threonine protein kinase
MIGKAINNYIVERILGEGGMGVVYYARHNRIDREVAIKILHSNLFTNEGIRNRFKNEANALIKLDHPNIVKIYDYVEQDNFACLIMEFIKGLTLDDYIEKITGPLASQKATSIISKVLDAVQYAHDRNIYHRDIKPGNIMLSRDASMVKIMDFGIAKLADSSALRTTHASAQLGTPYYMSPEQVKGLPVTKLSDIYSLGITFYEMVTGKCPYSQISNLFELQSKIVNEPLPNTSIFYPGVSSKIQNAIQIATNKTPEQRFQSCLLFKQFITSDCSIPGINQQSQKEIQKQAVFNQNRRVAKKQKQIIKEKNSKNKNKKFRKGWIYIFSILIVISVSLVIYNVTSKDNVENSSFQQGNDSIMNSKVDDKVKIPETNDNVKVPVEKNNESKPEVIVVETPLPQPDPPSEQTIISDLNYIMKDQLSSGFDKIKVNRIERESRGNKFIARISFELCEDTEFINCQPRISTLEYINQGNKYILQKK